MLEDANPSLMTADIPTYSEVRRLMQIWRDRTSRSAVYRLIKLLFEQTGTPAAPVDWAEPDSWIRKLMARRNKNVAAVALANKNARIIWALLAKDRMFRPDYTPAAVVAGT